MTQTTPSRFVWFLIGFMTNAGIWILFHPEQAAANIQAWKDALLP